MSFLFRNNSDPYNNSCYSALRLLFAFEPDTNTVDNEFENKHYLWFWDSDVLFPKYNSDIFLVKYSDLAATKQQFPPTL